MTFTGGYDDPRVVALRREHQQRLTRFFISFALIEGVVLAAVAVLAYGLRVVEPDQGLWLLVAVAVIGAVVLSTSLMTMMRRQRQELHDLGVPLGPADGDPNNAG